MNDEKVRSAMLQTCFISELRQPAIGAQVNALWIYPPAVLSWQPPAC